MGCCSCFDILLWGKPREEPKSTTPNYCRGSSQEHLLGCSMEEVEKACKNGAKQPAIASVNHFVASFPENPSNATIVNKHALDESQSNLLYKELTTPEGIGIGDDCHGSVLPVKETRRAIRGEDSTGKKMINEYVREGNIGTGSYSKVVLHRSKVDGKLNAIKIFHKSRLRKIKVTPSETALTDVLREVSIMKKLDHPNIVKLIEVIDDPESDHLYMVLEYVEGSWMFEGSGPPGGIGEPTAQRYLRDIVAGLKYLHGRRIIHGDIKPENLLITDDGKVKICDFSVSQTFENDNDELQRSPGTPVYTAPECCLGSTYRGKAADIWALGVTLYCMVLGCYPFLGHGLPSTYDEIIHRPLKIPEGLSPDLVNLLEGLLCKDPNKRLTLDAVVKHPWCVKVFDSLQQGY